MRIGIIGRGPWGQVYANTLRGLGVAFWQIGRDLGNLRNADGVIIASAAHSHMPLAEAFIESYVPVLIEKPIALVSANARHLLDLAKRHHGIVFTGHTRLHSNAWRQFKARALAEVVHSVYATAGGPCKLTPLWDWGPHLVAMCLDLGFDPLKAHILTDGEEEPLRVIVNGKMEFRDVDEKPAPLEVLLTEFMEAIKKGEPDVRGLELGVSVVEHLEGLDERRRVLLVSPEGEGHPVWH